MREKIANVLRSVLGRDAHWLGLDAKPTYHLIARHMKLQEAADEFYNHHAEAAHRAAKKANQLLTEMNTRAAEVDLVRSLVAK